MRGALGGGRTAGQRPAGSGSSVPGEELELHPKVMGILNRDVSVMRYVCYGNPSEKVGGRGAKARWRER